MKRFRILAGAATASALVAAPAALQLPSALRAALWGVVMLISLVGWGTVVQRWLAPRQPVDWGLRAAWGLAAFVLAGGFLCLAHLATRATFILQIAVGVVMLFVTCSLRSFHWLSRSGIERRAVAAAGRPATLALTVAGYALATLMLAASLGNHRFQPSDDPPFYFMLSEKLVQIGSMFEPFAARRVTVLGGQVYLQASFVSVASIYYLHVVDAGISQLIVVGLLVGQSRRMRPSPAQAVGLGFALLLLFTLREVRINTTSHGTGLVIWLALYRTVRVHLGPESTSERDSRTWPMEPRRIVALSALALTSVLLRVSNGPAALLFVALVVCIEWFRRTGRPWTWESLSALCRAGALSSATLLLGLLPWSLLERESTGTFFYPLGHGNLTPGWTLGLASPSGLRQEWAELFTNLSYGRPLGDFAAFVLAGLCALFLRKHIRSAPVEAYDVMALCVASFVGFFFFSHNAMAFGRHHVARYCSAFVAATGLIVAQAVDGSNARSTLVAAAIAYHVGVSAGATWSTFGGYFADARHASRDDHEFMAKTQDYSEIQSKVPPGATMATAVFEGFRFDFRRNPIFALDVLGGAGPKPGWPAKQGPQAIGNYLMTNGVRYLVWVDFDLKSEFYNKSHWTSNLKLTGQYLQPQAVLLLDAEDSIEKLSAARTVVYRAHGMTLVDLAPK